jgi:small subunit ribosomal protein S8
MMTDSIANILSLINNGLRAKLSRVNVPSSKQNVTLLEVFKEEGYITDFATNEVRKGVSEISINLKYSKFGVPAITNLIKVSKPGRRMYSGIKALKSYSSGMGIYVLSTSKGIISEKKARRLNVGGEILCRVF